MSLHQSKIIYCIFCFVLFSIVHRTHKNQALENKPCSQSMNTQQRPCDCSFEAVDHQTCTVPFTNESLFYEMKERDALKDSTASQSVTRMIFTRNVISSRSHTHTHRIPFHTRRSGDFPQHERTISTCQLNTTLYHIEYHNTTFCIKYSHVTG